MSFHQIRSRERAKYADRQLDVQIMPGVFQHSYQKREAKITKSFRSGIINLLIDGFTYNTHRHFARKNTPQLAKYPRVLYIKLSNTMYILTTSNILDFQSPLFSFKAVNVNETQIASC